MRAPTEPECSIFNFPCIGPEPSPELEEAQKQVRDFLIPDSVQNFGTNTMDAVGRAFQESVGWFFKETSSWWVQIDSPDLEREQAVGHLQNLFQPVQLTVAVLAMLLAAGKMALTRKADPLIGVGSGLALVATVAAIGVTLPNLLLRWVDEWTEWVLNTSTGDAFAERMTQIVTASEAVPGVLAFVLGLVALIIGGIQAILLLFRQSSLIILAGVLPLAAAGTLAPATRDWLKKVTGWMLSMIFYPAAAAAVYAAAFTLIGTSTSLQTTLMGLAMLVLALVAFPVLLKFFTWTTGADSSGSGGGGLLGAVIGGATAIGAARGFGPVGAAAGAAASGVARAAEHAGHLDQQLGSAQPQGSGSPPSADQPGRQQLTAAEGNLDTGQQGGSTPPGSGNQNTEQRPGNAQLGANTGQPPAAPPAPSGSGPTGSGQRPTNDRFPSAAPITWRRQAEDNGPSGAGGNRV
ncbi:hypothetical protein [Actinocorallia populi]|uniref:hypothetical protein n=1 Tax=Actinocorallia populi TaxID=2079200 RepID=UPI000D095AC7|nr:hypothetical protein [Actinocorallia populi]